MTLATDRPRLFLDVQGIQDLENPERGVPRFVAMQALALARIPGVVAAMGLNPTRPFPASAPRELAEDPRLVWNTAAEFSRLAREGPLVYYVMSPMHAPAPVEASMPPWALDSDVTLAMTLYDIIPRLFPEVYLRNPAVARRYRMREVLWQHSDLLLTLSHHGRQDAIDELGIPPDRIHVIGGGVAPDFVPPSSGSRGSARCGVPRVVRPYLLTITYSDPRKSTETLVRAFARLPERLRAEHQVVIAGSLKGEWLDLVEREIVSCGLTPDDVVITGVVSDAELLRLYQHAELFVNPSTYEGFGLPVVEAAACGCPALVTADTALEEVLDFPPATFPPRNAHTLATLIARTLTDSTFRAQVTEAAQAAARRHTWERVAERTVAAIWARRGVERSRARASRRHPTRVAIVTPVDDPAAAAVIAELSERARVDVFTWGPDRMRRSARRELPDRVSVMPLRAIGFPRALTAFDLVVLSMEAGDELAVGKITGQADRIGPVVVWARTGAAFSDAHHLELARSARALVADSPEVLDALARAEPIWRRPELVDVGFAAGSFPRQPAVLTAVIGETTTEGELDECLAFARDRGATLVFAGSEVSGRRLPLRARARRLGMSERVVIMTGWNKAEARAWMTRSSGVLATGDPTTAVSTLWVSWGIGRPAVRVSTQPPPGGASAPRYSPSAALDRLLALAHGAEARSA